MSVSSRDRKSVIYAELERFRSLCDQQEQQLRAQSEANERLREALRASEQRSQAPSSRPQAPNASGRRTKLEDLKAFATKFKCCARLRGGVIELYSRKRGCWVAVPEGTQP